METAGNVFTCHHPTIRLLVFEYEWTYHSNTMNSYFGVQIVTEDVGYSHGDHKPQKDKASLHDEKPAKVVSSQSRSVVGTKRRLPLQVEIGRLKRGDVSHCCVAALVNLHHGMKFWDNALQ
jgi:hypothetical protein